MKIMGKNKHVAFGVESWYTDYKEIFAIKGTQDAQKTKSLIDRNVHYKSVP